MNDNILIVRLCVFVLVLVASMLPCLEDDGSRRKASCFVGAVGVDAVLVSLVTKNQSIQLLPVSCFFLHTFHHAQSCFFYIRHFRQSVREQELTALHGRKIAIDASMAIYQFLIAVRTGGPGQQAAMLTNDQGDPTSHIQGMFNRTIRFMTEGIKPVYVFDGKPPQIKSGELQKRREKRQKAEQALKQAAEDGNIEEQDKQSKRLVRASKKENDDCKRLLALMGVPVVEAPCEAEAQAAALAKAGKVWATGTEDMDAMTFATPVLVRKMAFANQSKSKVQTIDYAKAIRGLGMTHDEFVDLCILLGCDYCDSIKGVGPKTALKLIHEHKNIETILKHLDEKKMAGVPADWLPPSKKKSGDEEDSDREEEEEGDEDENEQFIPTYVQARKLFNEHEVLTDVELKWQPCQAVELTKFLVDEQGFNPERVKANIEKLQAAYKKNQKPQARLDSFFAVKPSASKPKKPAAKQNGKRKAEPAKGKKGAKRR